MHLMFVAEIVIENFQSFYICAYVYKQTHTATGTTTMTTYLFYLIFYFRKNLHNAMWTVETGERTFLFYIFNYGEHYVYCYNSIFGKISIKMLKIKTIRA